jgi:hypothetical protein
MGNVLIANDLSPRNVQKSSPNLVLERRPHQQAGEGICDMKGFFEKLVAFVAL